MLMCAYAGVFALAFHLSGVAGTSMFPYYKGPTNDSGYPAAPYNYPDPHSGYRGYANPPGLVYGDYHTQYGQPDPMYFRYNHDKGVKKRNFIGSRINTGYLYSRGIKDFLALERHHDSIYGAKENGVDPTKTWFHYRETGAYKGAVVILMNTKPYSSAYKRETNKLLAEYFRALKFVRRDHTDRVRTGEYSQSSSVNALITPPMFTHDQGFKILAQNEQQCLSIKKHDYLRFVPCIEEVGNHSKQEIDEQLFTWCPEGSLDTCKESMAF
ncbi:hypothetical protein NEDG_02086 [Nematocida displodere]|uniref:Uncharacterized protein n=1 Tax=Nematocida displodere TaxID=1805483 RepID=A0A177EJP1_9MICR|nr:hypothetical protein NEDG_02086 [Nematocida displodere]